MACNPPAYRHRHPAYPGRFGSTRHAGRLVISRTPLRISFAGGGTDLREFYQDYDGRVLSSAIDKYAFIIVKTGCDDDIVVNHTDNERVQCPDRIRHDLVREAVKKVGIQKGIEITTRADIPPGGSGLGSSSSATVGLLNALYAYQDIRVDSERLAREACEIEIDIVGKPIGKQDQYIAAYGGFRFIEFYKDECVRVSRIGVTDEKERRFGACILLFDTGIPRNGDEILGRWKRNYTTKVDCLQQMKQQADTMLQLLNHGQFDDIGMLLHEAWQYKKSLGEGITTPAVDRMYENARQAGALGGKLCGAGGGGFLLLYCRREKQADVRRALNAYRELPFVFERSGSEIIVDKDGRD